AADPRLQKVADWLLDREIKIKGDWAENVSFPEATGWAFEFNNDFYPDVDDTFQVVLALRVLKATDEPRRAAAIQRAIAWCRAFQCQEGGFAAFDRDLTTPWLEQVPFADHNAILDPPCSDITGRALETLAKMGYTRADPVVQRALAFVWRTQEPDGSWFGRWGVNYIYGTSHVLRGLALLGEDMTQPRVQRARAWLESVQNPDGGWGESCWTYHDHQTRGHGAPFFDVKPAGPTGELPHYGPLAGGTTSVPSSETKHQAPGTRNQEPRTRNQEPGTKNLSHPSTASQTSWALLGLLACCAPDAQSLTKHQAPGTKNPALARPSIETGIQYLLSTQQPDGSWHYPWFTGTGFPRIFYLKYTSYQWAWPLLALTWYKNLSAGKNLPE
ncbi:MAG TPA: prenyltransferase/squalene oxidase repeat-containing protein, partial [Opitutales bacterium]|nr:prenyltransferase/squalene oxidase repeat-containing protein [Opitutales bacterium]